MPGVRIFSDCCDLDDADLTRHGLTVGYLAPGNRPPAHARAHVLSVEGRARIQPDVVIDDEIARAKHSTMSKGAKQRHAVARMLEIADADPAFDGDFVAVVERRGWTHGNRWRDNRLIKIAGREWQRRRTSDG